MLSGKADRMTFELLISAIALFFSGCALICAALSYSDAKQTARNMLRIVKGE